MASSEERRLIRRQAAIRAELDRRKTPSQRQAEATGYAPADDGVPRGTATERQVGMVLDRGDV